VNFRFFTLLGDFKDNVCVGPLGLVFDKVEVVLQNVPNDFLARYEFGDFECTTVNVLVVVIKHSAEFVGVSLNRSIAMFRMRVKSNSKGAANGSPHCPRKDSCFLGRLIHH
jgi:hypothetical protein